MFNFQMDVQRQPQDHQYGTNLPHVAKSQKVGNSFVWQSVESESGYSRQNVLQRNMRASSVSSQSSPRLPDSGQHYTEQFPQPAQATDLMGSSSGPYYGPYTSRASSTLPSPCPMTPNTEDMFHQWSGNRRPSDFATSAAQSSFSPRSPRDYDFPTGNHLPPYMDGSHRPTPRANLFSEAFHPYPPAPYLGQGPLPLDSKSDTAMNGPPYPAQIVDPHGGVPYLDPHVLNTHIDGSYAAPEEEDLLPLGYVAANFHPLAPNGIYHANQSPTQESEYVDANNHGDAEPMLNELEDTKGTNHLTKNTTGSKAPFQHAAQHRKPSSQHAISRRSSNQVRAPARSPNQCTICHKPFDSQTKLRKHTRKEHIRPYPCIFAQYGCNSVFGTKNEWSRHVKVQHLRLETWRCNIDECEKYVPDDSQLVPPASKGRSEYDRKDLFLNHVRRCHKERYPKPNVVEGQAAVAFEEESQKRCHMTLRSPPTESLCHCCPDVVWAVFDERLEHVGKAMESNEDARAGFQDQLLENYLLNEKLLCKDNTNRWLLTGAEGKKGGRQARRPAQKSPTLQAPLSSTRGRHEPAVEPSRKSRRVALKQQQLKRQVKQEENSEDDAEAEPDEDYAVN